MRRIILLLAFFLASYNLEASDKLLQEGATWKAGVAKVVITPEHPMWMAGFASRKKPSEGKLHDLWAKALVVEDAEGKQALLITLDLSGIPKSVSDRVRKGFETKYSLSRSQVIINTSHTHSGPVLQDALMDLYPLDEQQLSRIKQYTDKLEGQLETLVKEALGAMQPVSLFVENGITRFQVNRRNNVESAMNAQTDLNGPNDYSVPVIKVVSKEGKLLAVAFGYACHNTVLSDYKWSGDYAGFAQIQLEKNYAGTTALFFQGCGGNQNPLPRGTVALAQQYGTTLAAAVDGVLQGDMRQLESRLATSYSEIELPFSRLPTKEELTKVIATSSGYVKKWAEITLQKLDKGGSLRTSYPYPVQVWKLGDHAIIGLGGEPVIEYAIRLKQLFGQNIFVLGYSNDVMAYIPTAAIIREGGYEGATSQMAFGLPSPWAVTVESMILQEVMRLAKQVDLRITE